MEQVRTKRWSLFKAIRKHCLDCCGNSSYEVKSCTGWRCNLYPYRFGKNVDLGTLMTYARIGFQDLIDRGLAASISPEALEGLLREKLGTPCATKCKEE